jgi:hypothetical protein
MLRCSVDSLARVDSTVNYWLKLSLILARSLVRA